MSLRVFLFTIVLLVGTHAYAQSADRGTGISQRELAKRDSLARYEQQQGLLKKLAAELGYKLDHGELLKYLADANSSERNLFHYILRNPKKWSAPPQDLPFDLFMLVFRTNSEGMLEWERSQEGVTTLSEVLHHVLNLRLQEFECPPALLTTYMPGDWVMSWNPNEPHSLTDAELAAVENILNKQKKLGVKIAWKTVEKAARVITGKYRANPQSEEGADDSGSYEGSFSLIARRSHTAGTGGTYEDFKQAIGEALMLPVVDEAEVRPENKSFLWIQSGTPVMNSERLPAEEEGRVLESLHDQMGYDFRIEPREVKLLSIQPVDE